MATHVPRSNQAAGYGVIAPQNHHGIVITTGNDFPGYRIEQIHGTVYGITVRSRNIGANIGAGFKSLVGGELKSWTKNVVASRDEALDRMLAGVREVGGNAVLAFRFDNGSLGEGLTEVCCYGTAVTVRPLNQGQAYGSEKVQQQGQY